MVYIQYTHNFCPSLVNCRIQLFWHWIHTFLSLYIYLQLDHRHFNHLQDSEVWETEIFFVLLLTYRPIKIDWNHVNSKYAKNRKILKGQVLLAAFWDNQEKGFISMKCQILIYYHLFRSHPSWLTEPQENEFPRMVTLAFKKQLCVKSFIILRQWLVLFCYYLSYSMNQTVPFY